MQNIHNLTLKQQLWLGFGLLIGLALLAGTTAIVQLYSLTNLTTEPNIDNTVVFRAMILLGIVIFLSVIIAWQTIKLVVTEQIVLQENNESLQQTNKLLGQTNQRLKNYVTRHHDINRALRERDVRYQQMFAKHSSIQLLVNPDDGQIVEANSVASDYYGYTMADLKQMKISEINTLSQAEIEVEKSQANVEKRSYFRFKHRLASGEVRQVNVHSGPVNFGGQTLIYSIIHDVTDRHRAERALRDSEEKFRMLLNNAPYAIIITNEVGIISLINLKVIEMFGYHEADLVGKPIELLMPERFKRQHVELRGMYQQKPEKRPMGVGLELYGKRQDGSEFPIDVGLSFVNTARGLLITCFVSDITERKTAELALKKSEATSRSFYTLAEDAPDGFAVVELDGQITYLNNSLRHMLQYEDEAIGMSFLETSTATPDFLLAMVQDVVKQGVWQGEIEYKRKDGTTFDGQVSMIRIEDEAGQPQAIGAVIRDVTERNQLEAELREHRDNLEDMVMHRTYRLEVISMLSGHLNSLRDLNVLLETLVNQLKQSFGYYHVHIYLLDPKINKLVMFEGSGDIGQQLKAKQHQLNVGQGIVGVVASSNQYFFSNNVDNVERFFRNPLLPHTKAELAVPLRNAGNVIGVLDIQSEEQDSFTADDVTLMQLVADHTSVAVENARLLAERQATILKLKEVDRVKSQFITMMSHELRTPLNAINGFAEILMLGLSGELPQQAQDDVKLIYDSGQHLLRLINDILDISQIESGQIQINPQPIVVSDILNDVIATATPLVQNKSLTLVREVPDDFPTVYADPTRLKQILLNLVGNAIKFTSEGQVILKVDSQTVDEIDMALFSIIDTGIGIPQEKQQLVFEQFQQVDMSDSREYGGSGLGLTICKQLVQMHHGQIHLHSEEDVGSTFSFTIPLANGIIETGDSSHG